MHNNTLKRLGHHKLGTNLRPKNKADLIICNSKNKKLSPTSIIEEPSNTILVPPLMKASWTIFSFSSFFYDNPRAILYADQVSLAYICASTCLYLNQRSSCSPLDGQHIDLCPLACTWLIIVPTLISAILTIFLSFFLFWNFKEFASCFKMNPVYNCYLKRWKFLRSLWFNSLFELQNLYFLALWWFQSQLQ